MSLITYLAELPWAEIGAALATGAIRSVAGWIENAWADKKISPFEWAQLGETMTRVSLLTIATYLPLEALGVDGAILASAGSAFVLDWLIRKLTKAPVAKKK